MAWPDFLINTRVRWTLLLSNLSESLPPMAFGNASLRHSPAHTYDIYEDQLVRACYSRLPLRLYLHLASAGRALVWL
jgi:hypothetical protein